MKWVFEFELYKNHLLHTLYSLQHERSNSEEFLHFESVQNVEQQQVFRYIRK